MDKSYKLFQHKMAKFNSWENDNIKKLDSTHRLEQFLILYDIGQKHSDDTVKQMHEEHLSGIIKMVERLKKAKNNHSNIL